jgi:hypothetical protein
MHLQLVVLCSKKSVEGGRGVAADAVSEAIGNGALVGYFQGTTVSAFPPSSLSQDIVSIFGLVFYPEDRSSSFVRNDF